MSTRNKLLEQIVLALGGTVTNPNNRNQLLQDWLNAVGGSPPSTRLVANLNGLTQYAKPSDITVSGDYEASIKIQSTAGLGAENEVVIGNDSLTTTYIGFLSNGTFRYRSPRGGNIDASLPVELLNSTAAHTLTMRFVGNNVQIDIDSANIVNRTTSNTSPFVINAFGVYDTSIGFFFEGRLYDFTDSQGNIYAMGDGWPNNPIMANSGTGLNGTWINLTEASWEEIPA